MHLSVIAAGNDYYIRCKVAVYPLDHIACGQNSKKGVLKSTAAVKAI